MAGKCLDIDPGGLAPFGPLTSKRSTAHPERSPARGTFRQWGGSLEGSVLIRPSQARDENALVGDRGQDLFAIRRNVLRDGPDVGQVTHFAGSVHERSTNRPASVLPRRRKPSGDQRPHQPIPRSRLIPDWPGVSNQERSPLATSRVSSGERATELIASDGPPFRSACPGGRTSSPGRVRLFRDATRSRRRGRRKTRRDPTLLPVSIQHPVGATRHHLPTFGPCDPISASRGCRCGQTGRGPPPAGV